jgi:hypothetical protein
VVLEGTELGEEGGKERRVSFTADGSDAGLIELTTENVNLLLDAVELGVAAVASDGELVELDGGENVRHGGELATEEAGVSAKANCRVDGEVGDVEVPEETSEGDETASDGWESRRCLLERREGGGEVPLARLVEEWRRFLAGRDNGDDVRRSDLKSIVGLFVGRGNDLKSRRKGRGESQQRRRRE